MVRVKGSCGYATTAQRRFPRVLLGRRVLRCDSCSFAPVIYPLSEDLQRAALGAHKRQRPRLAQGRSRAQPVKVPAQRASDISAISLSAAFLRSALNSRCMIECRFLQNCLGWNSGNPPTMASAVSCGSAASSVDHDDVRVGHRRLPHPPDVVPFRSPCVPRGSPLSRDLPSVFAKVARASPTEQAPHTPGWLSFVRTSFACLGQAAPDLLCASASGATDERLIIHVWKLSDCGQVLPCSYSQGRATCYDLFAYRYPALLRKYPGPDRFL
jgi:hypothetical protein